MVGDKMAEKYDIIKMTEDDCCGSGLSAGSEHYVAIAQMGKVRRMLGIIGTVNGADAILWVHESDTEIIGKAATYETMGYIDEFADNADSW